MIKISFDISTRSTGVCIQQDNITPAHCQNVYVNHNDIFRRVQIMGFKVLDILDKNQYDILIISKALQTSYYTKFSKNKIINPISLIEGMVLGEAIKNEKQFEYVNDVSWYTMIGMPKDQRSLKKFNSVVRYLERHDITDDDIDKTTAGDKIRIVLKNGQIITDDIADAFNAGDLYEQRLLNFKERQIEQNKKNNAQRIRKEIKKISLKIFKLKSNIKIIKNEVETLEKELNSKYMKRTENSIDIRKKRIEKIEDEISNYKNEQQKLKNELQGLGKEI